MVGDALMGIVQKIKNMLWKGAAVVGATNSLSRIVDDSRISMSAAEYDRIIKDFKYYANRYDKVSYIDAENVRRYRPFNSVNLTKRAAQRIASIVFNEQCEISFDNDEVGEYLNDVLSANDFKNQFEMNLEKGVVAGGFAMRPYVGTDGTIKIAWVRADQFFPLQSNTNSISEAAISSRTVVSENNRNVYYTLLEFHEWKDNKYVVTNELYRSETADIVGNQVPLATLYPDMEPQAIFDAEGMIKPLFSYFRMPGANNISLESPLGIGIVDNSKTALDNLNLTHDSFMWEIRNGKRKIAVPEELMKFDKHTHRPMFDTDTDVYVKMIGDDISIQDMTNDIRVQQFTDSMNAWLREFEANIGMAPGTFSYDPHNGMQTATAVVSENSMTYQTRSSILTNVTAAIEQLCVSILELSMASKLFPNGESPFTLPNDFDLNDIGIHVKYDDGVTVDKDKQMEEDLKNVVAGVLSKTTFLQRNYGLSEDDAREELAKIQAEQPDADTIGGQQTTELGGGDGD
jgi:A118 family predicted phage portal protein